MPKQLKSLFKIKTIMKHFFSFVIAVLLAGTLCAQTADTIIIEEAITNLAFYVDSDPMYCTGSSDSDYDIEVNLVLGNMNPLNGTIELTNASSIIVNGQNANFISGYLYEVDITIRIAKAIIIAKVGEQIYEFHLNMSATPEGDAIVIKIDNATIELQKKLLFSDPIMGDVYDHSLTMKGNWTNEEDGLIYPVLVEVSVYYPDATEENEAICNVKVGDNKNNLWIGEVKGCYLTITTADDIVTAKGVVVTQNTKTLDLTISGSIASDSSAVDNITTTVVPVKVIENGQLIIIKNGVKYNVAGAVVK